MSRSRQRSHKSFVFGTATSRILDARSICGAWGCGVTKRSSRPCDTFVRDSAFRYIWFRAISETRDAAARTHDCLLAGTHSSKMQTGGVDMAARVGAAALCAHVGPHILLKRVPDFPVPLPCCQESRLAAVEPNQEADIYRCSGGL